MTGFGGYLWIPKRVQVGEPGWLQQVVRAPACPDQRRMRRLTYTERERAESEGV